MNRKIEYFQDKTIVDKFNKLFKLMSLELEIDKHLRKPINLEIIDFAFNNGWSEDDIVLELSTSIHPFDLKKVKIVFKSIFKKYFSNWIKDFDTVFFTDTVLIIFKKTKNLFTKEAEEVFQTKQINVNLLENM